MILTIAAGGFLLLISGCAHQTKAVLPEGGATQLTRAAAIPPPAHYEPGSLWATNRAGSLFEDTRARRVGDLVMVRVVENATGTKTAATKTDRNTSISTGIKTFFGAPVANRNLDVGLDSAFDGNGSTARSGRLTALVAASVVEVLPNGNLQINGAREIQVNDELQIIHLSGMVRPVDIATDNIVLSSRIADAKITYTGLGVLDERQRPGWFSRMLDYLTPF